MRSSKSRSRSKANRPRTLGNIINRVFDSSGPEGKVRGTPQQIIEKYQMLARDAQLSNDRVAAENFLQHAEHYTRLLAEAMREMAAEQDSRNAYQNGQNGGQARYDNRADAGARLPSLGEGDQPDFAGAEVIYPDVMAIDMPQPDAPPRGYPPRVGRANEPRAHEGRPNNRPREDRREDRRDDRPRDERRSDKPRSAPRSETQDRGGSDRANPEHTSPDQPSLDQPNAEQHAANRALAETAAPMPVAQADAAPAPFLSPAELVAQLAETSAPSPKPRAPRLRRAAPAAGEGDAATAEAQPAGRAESA